MVLLASSLTLALASCDQPGAVADAGADTDDSAFACPVPSPTVCPSPPPRYPDIAPIVNRLCVPCHMGVPNGPWPLTSYMHVADWQDIIQAAMMDCSMPPIDAEFRMQSVERTALLTWVLCGFLP